MKNRKLIYSAFVAVALVALVFTSCKKKEDTSFNLMTLVSGSSDLNGATTPTDVSPTGNIVGTFSTDVDASTANNTNITVTRDFDGADVPLTATVSGATLTITPSSALDEGALYHLNLGAGLKGTNGTAFVATERNFQTAGTFVPEGEVAFWNFENNLNDQVGGLTASGTVDITYSASHNANAGVAGTFNGTTSYTEFPGAGPTLENTDNFALAFWVYCNSINHVDSSGNPKGNFVMGAGFFKGFQFEIGGDYSYCKLAAQYNLDTVTGSEDLWFNGGSTGTTKDNGGWQGWTFCQDLTGSGGVAGLLQDKWAHIVCVYDATTKVGSLYINGQLMKAQDFNLWPAGDPKTGCIGLEFDPTATDVGTGFVFGFAEDKSSTLFSDQPWGNVNSPYSNHFQGSLDNVRFFHHALTATEVSLLYNSEK